MNRFSFLEGLASLIVFLLLCTPSLHAQPHFGMGPQQPVSDGLEDASSVTSADMNDDGTPEIVSTFAESRKIAWFDYEDGFSGGQTLIETSEPLRGPYAVDVQDLDEDGVVDVAVGDADRVLVFLNNIPSDGGTERVATLSAQSRISEVELADADCDGLTDILVSTRDGKLGWYDQTRRVPTPTFAGFQQVGSGAGYAPDIEAVDLVESGCKEFVVTLNDKNRLAWFESDSSQTFERHLIEGEIQAPTSVTVLRYNANRPPELIAGGNDIVYYANLSPSTSTSDADFRPVETISPEGPFPLEVGTADLNLDGNVDIVAVQDGGPEGEENAFGEVMWFPERAGNATRTNRFGQKQTITTDVEGPYNLTVADFDGDCKPDVAVGEKTGAPSLTWHQNFFVDLRPTACLYQDIPDSFGELGFQPSDTLSQ